MPRCVPTHAEQVNHELVSFLAYGRGIARGLFHSVPELSLMTTTIVTASDVSPAVSNAVSFSRHSVDLRACCYDTDAQNLA